MLTTEWDIYRSSAREGRALLRLVPVDIIPSKLLRGLYLVSTALMGEALAAPTIYALSVINRAFFGMSPQDWLAQSKLIAEAAENEPPLTL